MAHIQRSCRGRNAGLAVASKYPEAPWEWVSEASPHIFVCKTDTDCSKYVTEGDVNLQFAPGSKIPSHFVHWRFPFGDSYTISPKGHPNTLRLKPSKLNLTAIDGNAGGPGGQTFVGRRQVDTLFTYSVDIDYTPQTLDEEAGVTLFLTQVGVLFSSLEVHPVNDYRTTMPASDSLFCPFPTQPTLPWSRISASTPYPTYLCRLPSPSRCPLRGTAKPSLFRSRP
jgi:hypothetical protein